MMNVNKLIRKFYELYEEEPLIVRSLGRVNIIGEHTDYNEGFVLPAAIDKAVYIAITKRDDQEIHLYSLEFDQYCKAIVSSLHPVTLGWPNYILGVIDQLKKSGYNINGCNIVVDGDLPLGAGLSSSAALECATAFALNEIFSLSIFRMDLVKAAQKAEHLFAGVRCGIMDQFASMFGRKDYALKLDCRTLDHEYIPFTMEGVKIILLNTNVKHALSSSEYNTRRQQCEQGVAWIKAHHPGVSSLRDVSMVMLDEFVKPQDAIVYKRCRYVVEENRRLLSACEDLRKGNIGALGEKMFETHKGLSEDYEVSCKELDFLVTSVIDDPGVLGARMMGGGFGGCTINLVKEQAIDRLIEKLSIIYKEVTGLDLAAYITQIENGTNIILQHDYTGI